MKKTYGTICTLMLVMILVTVGMVAASNPKATGGVSWGNAYDSGLVAHTVFSVMNTTPLGLVAKGSFMYSDANVTYMVDAKYMSVTGNTARIAGQVISENVTGSDGGCCRVGDWVYYKIQDLGEPGVGVDKIQGVDATQACQIANCPAPGPTEAIVWVEGGPNPPFFSPEFIIVAGNIQVH